LVKTKSINKLIIICQQHFLLYWRLYYFWLCLFIWTVLLG